MPDWNALREWSHVTAGLELSPAQIDQLAVYIDLLLFWNRRIALVSRSQSDPDAILSKHIADSLFAAARCAGAERIADLGSGGGFPGIPIAIVRPDAAISLIESTGKKASFLDETRRTVGCRNVTVLHDRIEAVSRQAQHAGQYHLATARALSDLDTLCELARPLLTPGGRLIAMRAVGESDPDPKSQPAIERSDYRLPDGTPRRLLTIHLA